MKFGKRLAAYGLMLLCSVFFLLPVAWALISSLKPENVINSYPPTWIPRPLTGENYALVFQKYPYLKWLGNSLLTSVFGTLAILVLSSMAAYALSRFRFKGREFLYGFIIVMMLIPIQAYVIPLYLMSAEIGLLNTLAGITLPTIANVTSIFILKSFFDTLPVELEEAAHIDGCGDFRTFWQIMLPLSRPALSTVAIITFIANWNSYLWPMIASRNDATRTLPVAISQYWGAVNQNSTFQYGTALAACGMAVIPSLVIYFALQKYFVSGIANTGIKG